MKEKNIENIFLILSFFLWASSNLKAEEVDPFLDNLCSELKPGSCSDIDKSVDAYITHSASKVDNQVNTNQVVVPAAEELPTEANPKASSAGSTSAK